MRKRLEQIKNSVHGNVVEVELETIVTTHLLDESDFLQMSLLIDNENYVLIWSRLVMEACPDIIGEGVNAGIRIYV